MNIEKRRWTPDAGWNALSARPSSQLVMVFGSRSALENSYLLTQVRADYPSAQIVGCSTAGEIYGTRVTDEALVATAIEFDRTSVQCARVHVDAAAGSFQAGCQLGAALAREDLVHVVVFSDGLEVNGTDLVRGLTAALPGNVTVTGGLSADGDRFERTLVVWDGKPECGAIVGVGLYGNALKVGFASLGGWDPFGPERMITRSRENVLYELDGRSALDLYKEYLGDHAKELPASGLLFPLTLRTPSGGPPVVRTILGVNEKDGSMTFAGDVPQGRYARLMRANFDRLIDGASGAARMSYEAVGSRTPDLALLISCVGRKMVLGQRIEEEVEAVRDVLGPKATLTGFYSYGEISPFTPDARCELHNQTMTITTFTEA